MSITLTYRHLALLRAVADGRCELSRSCEPNLYIDGRACCDQQATHLLVHEGLVELAGSCRIGERVPARITPAGVALLRPVAA